MIEAAVVIVALFLVYSWARETDREPKRLKKWRKRRQKGKGRK